MAKSFHDDYIKTNADFRSKAGLEAYIVRKDHGGCCDWCAKLVGKYSYPDDVPKDVYRRHDNCSCTVTYECGKGRQDVWSKKTWEASEEEIEARKNVGEELVKYTSEQARKLEKEVAERVDISENSDIIKLSINLFDKSDPIYLDALSIEPEDGFEDVFLHGSQTSVQTVQNGKITNLNPKEFAELLKSNGYKGGNIRLASCSTGAGENSFAQQLSKELKTTVKAPDSDVYFIPTDGVLFVGSPYENIGEWRKFKDGVEIYD